MTTTILALSTSADHFGCSTVTTGASVWDVDFRIPLGLVAFGRELSDAESSCMSGLGLGLGRADGMDTVRGSRAPLEAIFGVAISRNGIKTGDKCTHQDSLEKQRRCNDATYLDLV